MQREPSTIKRDILLRVKWLYVIFFLLGITITARIVYVQFFSREIRLNAERLENRIFSKEVIMARRGAILARNGEPLAGSIIRHRLYFDFASENLRLREQTYYENCDSLAGLLSAYFGDRTKAEYDTLLRREYRRERDNYTLGKIRRDTVLKYPEFEKKSFLGRLFDRLRGRATYTAHYFDTLREHRRVELFPRPVDYAEWEVLRRWPLLNWNMGMVYHLEEEDMRIYPLGELARRTIGDRGYYGAADAKGNTLFHNYGIEDAFRHELAGHDGQAVRQRFARGFHGRVAGAEHEDPEHGMDVVTTLDVTLQEVAHNALKRQLEAQNATWGTTMVMDVASGELLAMANLGRRENGTYGEIQNYAISMTMDPGSTFKLATMLTLLEDARMSPSKQYDSNDGRPVKIGPVREIKDDHKGDRMVDLYQATVRSSNIYFAQAIWDNYSQSRERRMDYSNFLRDRLHLGETMGLEYLGEATPYVTDKWEVPDPTVMLVKMAYGYRVRMAPIHILTLYNAVANGGRMVAPLLVRELRRGDDVVERFESRVLEERIASDENLAIVRRSLRGVCAEKNGTAYRYLGDSTMVRAAGKTGTAQVTAPRTVSGQHYLATLVTYFPEENPRYTVLTTIETLKQAGKFYYGASLAGPVVEDVVRHICGNESAWFAELEGERREHPENIKGGSTAEVAEVADRLKLKIRADEDEMPWCRAVADSTGRAVVAAVDSKAGVMPDVRGMGLKDALFLLERASLKVRFSGAGRVVSQTPSPQSTIAAGQGATIVLK